MKTIGLDGKEFKVKLSRVDTEGEHKSSGHLKCREILKKLYPSDGIFEEVIIFPGLIVDFILPLRRLVLEVNGIQHYQMVKFFQKNLIKFNGQKSRDAAKVEWAKLNKFTLICLDTREQDKWEAQILDAFN